MRLTDENSLAAAFGRADAVHFHWQTQSAGIAERERALVHAVFQPLGAKILDLGCGEGATLYHLDQPSGAQGIELFDEKVAFANKHVPGCTFIQGTVYELPFAAQTFDQLIVRDLIHHLDEPERLAAECARVLAPGGRIDVLEPCRNNPLILLHAATNRAERGELRSTPEFLTQLLAPKFRIQSVTRHQPFPIHRLLYHPRLGSPRLAANSWSRRLVDNTERIAERVVPAWGWAYIHVRAFA